MEGSSSSKEDANRSSNGSVSKEDADKAEGLKDKANDCFKGVWNAMAFYY